MSSTSSSAPGTRSATTSPSSSATAQTGANRPIQQGRDPVLAVEQHANPQHSWLFPPVPQPLTGFHGARFEQPHDREAVGLCLREGERIGVSARIPDRRRQHDARHAGLCHLGCSTSRVIGVRRCGPVDSPFDQACTWESTINIVFSPERSDRLPSPAR